MSTDSDHPSGPAGTQRIEPASAGPAGTARIDVPAAGPAGTARLDAPGDVTAGPQGTARVDVAAGPQGTARVEVPAGPQGTARVGAGAAPAGAALDSTPVAWLRVGQSLQVQGRTYRIQSELSLQGGEARTYVALDEGGRSVVLKHYRPGVQAPQAVLQKLRAHPHRNVVAIIAFDTLDDRDVEVLEYMPGGTLDQHLRKAGPIHDLSLLRRLAAGIADGLDHLHDTVGLIYQDLKPENILVSGPDFERIVLADFGISTLREAGSRDVRVMANGTREYAAPELSRFGNTTEAFVTEKVDYFALGITLLECWQGTRPFQGIPPGRRIALIQDKEIPFPLDMDKTLETLVKGLVHPGVKDRFGRAELRRWIDRQALQVDYASSRRVYQRRAFRGDEYFANPAELAALLEMYPDKGQDYLYLGAIQKWLDLCEDMELSTEMQKIVRQFDRDDEARAAGLVRAVYSLDTERPFASAGGRSAATEDELAEVLLAEKAHYLKALTRPFDPFYLYLQARGESEFAADTLARFMSAQSAELSFNLLVYALQGGGRNQIRLLGQPFFQPEELATASPEVQAEVRRQVQSRESLLLIWLQRLGHVEKLDALGDADPVDQMGLLRALPWLSFKSLVPDAEQRQARIALQLLRRRREDLLPVFQSQGLDFNAQDGMLRPLVMASCNGMLEAIGFMLDHGGRLDLADGHHLTPLAGAVAFRQSAALSLLLSRGADAAGLDGQGRSMLVLACLPRNGDGKPEALKPADIQTLLDAGADVNRPGPDGVLPLHLALMHAAPADAPGLLDAMLKAGADIWRTGTPVAVSGEPDCNAWFAALHASQYAHRHDPAFLTVLPHLVQAGASVDELYGGKAALHWAAAWGSEALVQALLALKASTDQVGDDDMLPGTYARLKGHPALESLLAPAASWRGRILRLKLAAALAQGVVLLLVLMLLPALSMHGRRSLMTGDVAGLAWGWLWLVAATLAVQLSTLGGPQGVVAAVRRKLALPKGWLMLLVGGPVLGAAVGASVVALLWGSSIDVMRAMVWLAQGRWILAAAVGVALVACMRRRGRLLQVQAPWLKYQNPLATPAAAAAAAQSAGGNAWVMTGVMMAVLAVPVGVVLMAATRMAAPDVVRAPATTAPPTPGPVRNVDGQLYGPFAVRLPNGQSCTLPAGTRVLREADAVRSATAQREDVQVPRAVGACAGRILPGMALNVPASLLRPAAATLPRGPAVATAPAAPKPAAVVPPPASRNVAGPVQGLSGEGWPIVQGRTLALQGLNGIVPAQRKRFEGWLAAHQNQLNCEPEGAGAWRCLTPNGVDAAEALLLNGAAATSADAPPAYKDAMAKAVAERRGQWK